MHTKVSYVATYCVPVYWFYIYTKVQHWKGYFLFRKWVFLQFYVII